MAKEAPLGVKIISVLYYIGGAFGVLGGLGLIFGAGFMGSFLGALGGGLVSVVGVLIIAVGTMGILVGYNLWKLKNWARIVAMVFAGLGILSGLGSLFNGQIGALVWIIADGVIIWYLGFKEEVKKVFS